MDIFFFYGSVGIWMATRSMKDNFALCAPTLLPQNFYQPFPPTNIQSSQKIAIENFAIAFLVFHVLLCLRIKYTISGSGTQLFSILAARLSFSVLPLEALSDDDKKYSDMTMTLYQEKNIKEEASHMLKELKRYFPMIRTKGEILQEIRQKRELNDLFDSWTEEQQKESTPPICFYGSTSGSRA